jgi:hypothetical protein
VYTNPRNRTRIIVIEAAGSFDKCPYYSYERETAISYGYSSCLKKPRYPGSKNPRRCNGDHNKVDYDCPLEFEDEYVLRRYNEVIDESYQISNA